MNIPSLRECLEPGTERSQRVIFRKSARIDWETPKVFQEELPTELPENTVITISTDYSGCDCLEIIMGDEEREVLSRDEKSNARNVVPSYNNDYPVEALYTEINGFGIRAEFNRENAIKGDIKVVLQISECVDTANISNSVF
jgi:hypothetical protein